MSASSLATDLVTALGLPGCIGLLHPGHITTGNFFWKAATTCSTLYCCLARPPVPAAPERYACSPMAAGPLKDSHAPGGFHPAAARNPGPGQELRRGDACVALHPQHRMRQQGEAIGAPQKTLFLGTPTRRRPAQAKQFRSPAPAADCPGSCCAPPPACGRSCLAYDSPAFDHSHA
jgi:hypothetical protein